MFVSGPQGPLFWFCRAWYGMEWNGNFGTEYGRFQEWNGRQSSIVSNQFHSRFRALNLQKIIYGCQALMNDIVTVVFNFNIYEYYLSTNRGTMVVYIALTAYVFHHSKYIGIFINNVKDDDFDRFDFFFKINSLPGRNFFFFFFLPLSRKFVVAISSQFQLNFIYIFSF